MLNLSQIDNNTKQFYDFYKGHMEDILDKLYKNIENLKEDSNNYVEILYQELLENEKIDIDGYKNLICYIKINEIYLKNEANNVSTEIVYLKKVKFIKNNKLEEFFVCNDAIAMLLFNEKGENYIYYLRPKYVVENLDEEKSIQSLISDLNEIKYAIKNDLTIYSSDSPFYQLSDFKDQFSPKLEDINIINYLTGVNSYNFNHILMPKKFKFLRDNIYIGKKLDINKEQFQFYLYNAKIGLTTEILKMIDLSRIEKQNKKIYYLKPHHKPPL